MAASMRLFYMAIWRNWLSLKRYKVNFVFSLLSSGLLGFGLLLMAAAFDTGILERAMGTSNYVSFIVLGTSYQAWQSVALWGAAEMFRNELTTGQIDYTFACPFSRYAYIISNIGALAVQETLFFIPMFAVGLWFTRTTITLGGLALGLAATALSVAALSQMGACFASLVLRYRQVSGLFSLLNFAFQFLTGMFVPLQVLPSGLRTFGALVLPQSMGMDLLRHYVMGTRTLYAVPYEWAVLALQLVAYGILARVIVRWLERTARVQGLHYL